MNTKPAGTLFIRTMYIMVVLAVVLSVSTVVYAAPPSPFVGKWEAVDVDGSGMNLAIGGPATGPFQITWTDDYINFCDGEAGIIRGTGWLNEGDPNLLEADVHLECFRSGATLDFHVTLRYHPTTNTLSIRYWFGQVTIWHRSGGGQVEEPPALGLRVNYGHDWVESFYEGGHTAWVTVTDSDGNVKATAELVTEPKDFWGGETGFQTAPENWDPEQPDIQPYDWVYGWVDNGASAQVQIGEISGAVHLADDFIEGTIHAPWFSDEVEVDCHSWGAPLPEEILKYDTVLPDGEDMYTCSWAGEWDIQPYQDVGVGYSGPDGNWVANAIIPPNPRIVASEAGDWFWATEFYPGLLDLFIYESAEEGATLLWSGQQEAIDLWDITVVESNVHGLDLVPGNYLVVSDGVNSKGLVLQPISVAMFNTQNDFMAGFAPAGSEVWAAAGPQDWQERILVNADPDTGEWFADFAAIGFDITEDMRPWSYAHIYDEDGDANEGSTPPPPPVPMILGWLDWDVVEGNGWTIGDTVTLTIGDLIRESVVEPSSWDPSYGYVRFELGAEGYDLKIGDFVVMTDGIITKEILVPPLSITEYDLGSGTVSGTYDPALGLWIGVNGMEPVGIEFIDDTWIATFDGLSANMWGDAIQTDADGDDVRATIHTPNPNLYALPDENKIIAQVWIAGYPLDLKIYDANGNEIYSDSQTVMPPSEVPWTVVVFDLGANAFDLLPNQRVVLNQRGYERELLVSSLMITGFDLVNQQVLGNGDPGTQIFIRINGEDFWGEVDGDGNWAIYHPQLLPGVWGEAIQPDGVDGDETRDGFQVPFE